MSVAPVLRERSPSETVVEEVAAREGVDPADLTIPLFEAVDPEAVDALVDHSQRGGNSSLRIEFSYYGYDVAVASDGSVQVTDGE